MTTAQLLLDLNGLGIRLEAHGDRLRYSPRDALTPDLIGQLKSHKAELLAILRGGDDPPAIGPTDATVVDSESDHAGEPVEAIDPPAPCAECGSLELWESFAGNWRCLRCDPPTESRRLAEKAARLRERAALLKSDRTGWPRVSARAGP